MPSGVFPLWPGGVPGSESWDWADVEDSLYSGDRVIRNVAQPSLTAYLPENPNGTGVIVCPGGAFHFLSIDFEGTDVARALNLAGIAAFVLRYRLVRTGEDFLAVVMNRMRTLSVLAEHIDPLMPLVQEDARQAVRVVRSRADEWNVVPDKIGMLGFSAGAVVTVLAAVSPEAASRPDYAAPIYCGPLPHIELPQSAPPLFLLCANDDAMAVGNSLTLHNLWQAAERPVELHIYSRGGHGFGMKRQNLPVDSWLERFLDWLRTGQAAGS